MLIKKKMLIAMMIMKVVAFALMVVAVLLWIKHDRSKSGRADSDANRVKREPVVIMVPGPEDDAKKRKSAGEDVVESMLNLLPGSEETFKVPLDASDFGG